MDTTTRTGTDTTTEMQSEGLLDRMKGRLQEEWGELTNDDFEQLKGHWNQFVGRIKQRTGETTENIERKFKQFVN